MFPEEDEEDEEIKTMQNKIEIINLPEDEFNEHFESKSITSFNFYSSTSSNSFHILTTKNDEDEDDDDDEEDGENDSTNNLITKLMIFNRSNRYNNH